jgi:hypothetical protein
MLNLTSAMTQYGEVGVEPLRSGSFSFEPRVLQGSPAPASADWWNWKYVLSRFEVTTRLVRQMPEIYLAH